MAFYKRSILSKKSCNQNNLPLTLLSAQHNSALEILGYLLIVLSSNLNLSV